MRTIKNRVTQSVKRGALLPALTTLVLVFGLIASAVAVEAEPPPPDEIIKPTPVVDPFAEPRVLVAPEYQDAMSTEGLDIPSAPTGVSSAAGAVVTGPFARPRVLVPRKYQNAESTDGLRIRSAQAGVSSATGGAVIGPFVGPPVPVPPQPENAASTEGPEIGSAPVGSPLAPGNVIQSWSSGLAAAWGIAYSDENKVWVGLGWDPGNTIYEYLPDGTPTGRSQSYTWGPTFGPADSTFNWRTGMVWTMDVGGDDCIHEMNPATGYTGNTICGPWTVSQRGVAYDPATDTWYVGGWNDLMIYHISSSGTLLDSANVGLTISGLAYNPDTQHLFVQISGGTNDVYVLDASQPGVYPQVGQFHIGPLASGAGLEIDCDGNLWAVDQSDEMVYQAESGERAYLCPGGDAIQSWSSGLAAAWGVTYDGANDTVWVGSPVASWGGDGNDYEYQPGGTLTGRVWPENWGASYGPADMAFNWNTGMAWHLDVGGDDCLHELDPASGFTGNTICGPWAVSQRGVAYDPVSDTWYVGGWNDLMIYHIDSSGTLLDSANVGLAISGLAYNPDTRHLFVQVNSNTQRIYILDAATPGYPQIDSFPISGGFTAYGGAGLEFDGQAHLWAVDQNTEIVYQFESGEGPGSVVRSWSSGLAAAWGVTYDGADDTVWVGSPVASWGGDGNDYEHRRDGSATGRVWPENWGASYGPADMAFNWNTDMAWHLDVGGDDCLHELDPASGFTGNTICGPWATSQRGAAYDNATDTWYVGGWNEDTIYHIDSGGTLLDSAYVGLGISGLAYNPDTQHLFVQVNSDNQLMYVLDAGTPGYPQVESFAISEGFAAYSGAGLELDCESNLWAVDQDTETVYQFRSTETAGHCNCWETYGSWDGSIWNGGTRDRGNIFYNDSSNILSEIRLYLDFAASTDMYFFVYESDSLMGTYTKIHETFVANTGTGERWYSSGPIYRYLVAGRYYYVGASWNGTATYGRGTEYVPMPAACLGTLETGVPGPLAGYPPGNSFTNIYSGFSPYYLLLVTNTWPNISGVPNVVADHNTSLPVTVDLWAYASDGETANSGLTYTILGPPPAGAGVSIQGNRWLTINPSATWCGYTDVTVRVTDPGGLWNNDTFRVAVTWSCHG